MRGLRTVVLAAAVVPTICGTCGPTDPPPVTPAAYVGVAECRRCHEGQYQKHLRKGHAYALNAVVDAAPPSYPYRLDPTTGTGVPVVNELNRFETLPYGTNWSDLSYVVGGYRWSAVFMDREGRLITGPQASYIYFDLFSSAAVGGTMGPFPLENPGSPNGRADFGACAPCHTTGYTPSGSQEDLAGISGSWSEEGVQCEACHGPGSRHVESQGSISLSTDPQMCRTCHTGGDPHKVEVTAQGMIKTHQQWDEAMSGPHAFDTPPFARGCLTCHTDPHEVFAYRVNDPAVAQGDHNAICISCHPTDKWVTQGSPSEPGPMTGFRDDCIACHMPHVVSSGMPATLQSPAAPHGDVRSHVMSILVDSLLRAPDTMYDPSAAVPFLKSDASGRTFHTLDRACISCHRLSHAAVGTAVYGRLARTADTAMVTVP